MANPKEAKKNSVDQDKEIAVYDVLIVGAGLSGIGTAYWLQQKCPQKQFLVLEGRNSIGGTWDLFRYIWIPL
jgi:cation diffusion facilitator CzcD-associated flavoprotein CzcO